MDTSVAVLLIIGCMIGGTLARRRAGQRGADAERYRRLALGFGVAALAVALWSAWRTAADHRREAPPGAPPVGGQR